MEGGQGGVGCLKQSGSVPGWLGLASVTATKGRQVGQGLLWATLLDLQVKVDGRDGAAWSLLGGVGLQSLCTGRSPRGCAPGLCLACCCTKEHLWGIALHPTQRFLSGRQGPRPCRKEEEQAVVSCPSGPSSGLPYSICLYSRADFHVPLPPSLDHVACRGRANHTGSSHKTTDFNGNHEGGKRADLEGAE